MTTSSNGPDRRSGSPTPTSAVRPTERSTAPGHGGNGPRGFDLDIDVARPVSAAQYDPHATPSASRSAQRASPPSSETELDSGDIERVSLVELPTLARYGRYELLGRIAYGGMAEIFLCREVGEIDTRRLMAVKRVLPHVAEDRHFVDMFIDEARLAMQLNHPNICHVYTFGEAEGTYYLAMEWVNGKPLSRIIRRARETGGIPIAVALKITAQVAEALDYAHRATDATGEPLGIVHRDVSPQNIMVSFDGMVKLLDFGIAKATSHSTRTEAGVIKGKFAYMSPQQCVGEPIDARADVFALGICLYEALTGKNPFRRKTEFETMTKIVGEATPSIRERRPDLPEDVVAIVERALRKQPELRFQTAGEMQLAIEQAMASLGTLMNAGRVSEYIMSVFGAEHREGPVLDTRLSSPPKAVGMTSSEEPSIKHERPNPLPGVTDFEGAMMIARDPVSTPPRSGRGLAIAASIAIGLLLLALVATGGALAVTLFRIPAGGPPEVPIVTTPPDPIVPVVDRPSENDNGMHAERTATPPSDALGSIFVESDPPGAVVWVDDQEPAGETPLELSNISPGAHVVHVSLDGHEAFSESIEVEGSARREIVASLVRARGPRPTAAAGSLSINTSPWSKVYVGRRLLGTTPIGGASVPSGNVRLRFVDRDGNEHHRLLQVAPGQHVAESYDLH